MIILFALLNTNHQFLVIDHHFAFNKRSYLEESISIYILVLMFLDQLQHVGFCLVFL